MELIQSFTVDHTKIIPGTTPENCGNYLMHNLEFAKYYANEFASYLESNKNNNDIFEYPKSDRLVTDDGQQFFDS